MKTIVIVLFVGLLLLGVYAELNEIGWITHRANTAIYMKDDWLIGEKVPCSLNASGAKDAHILNCLFPYPPTNKFRVLSVQYHGRINRLSETIWQCQREAASVTCWAVN